MLLYYLYLKKEALPQYKNLILQLIRDKMTIILIINVTFVDQDNFIK